MNNRKTHYKILSPDVSVSIVIATLDRPKELRECLRCLASQKTPRKVEVVVVDNHPESALTPPVVAEFPGVRLVAESRRGLAYARNRGIIESKGDIIVTTDDDVRMPADWLEELIAPFNRTDVMVVTGNTLPLELETGAQKLFELYGGLGKGSYPKIADREWFRKFKSAVPTWELGATANAAFRATIFKDPQIGLMDVVLGPGTPTGVGEDTYLFYRVLKTGFTIVYNPEAIVWHLHRRDMKGLRRQLYDYSKGHVAYHLTTLIQDHDIRVLPYLLARLPAVHLIRILRRICGKSKYPLSLISLEIAGNLVGPWSLWRSNRRAKRDGRSGPWLPSNTKIVNSEKK